MVWSLIEATTNQLARMLMGYLVDHCIVYCLMEKVFRFIYLKNMGRVCGGIWLASCRRSVCACVGGSSSSQSRAWFGWEAELTGWYFQKNKIKEWTGWKLIE